VAQATGLKPEEVMDKAAHDSVTGRFTQPGEVADAVLLLVSERAANITGADITVDGGLIPTW
jgi:NAD(P)-dependent dehydrogenase (short-subunit alcohol dehydrogenase family)